MGVHSLSDVDPATAKNKKTKTKTKTKTKQKNFDIVKRNYVRVEIINNVFGMMHNRKVKSYEPGPLLPELIPVSVA